MPATVSGVDRDAVAHDRPQPALGNQPLDEVEPSGACPDRLGARQELRQRAAGDVGRDPVIARPRSPGAVSAVRARGVRRPPSTSR